MKCPEVVSRATSIAIAEKIMVALQADNDTLVLQPTDKQWGLVVTNINLLNATMQEFDGGWSDEVIQAIVEADEVFLSTASKLKDLPFHERYHYKLLDKHLMSIITDAMDRKKLGSE